MTQKKTMTKSEAREWFRGKGILIHSQYDFDIACAKIQSFGFEKENGCEYDDHGNCLMLYRKEDDIFSIFESEGWGWDEQMVELSDLLSIEIVEEPVCTKPICSCMEFGGKRPTECKPSPDPSELLKEAVQRLRFLYNQFDKIDIGYLASLTDEEYEETKEFLTKHSGRV